VQKDHVVLRSVWSGPKWRHLVFLFRYAFLLRFAESDNRDTCILSGPFFHVLGVSVLPSMTLDTAGGLRSNWILLVSKVQKLSFRVTGWAKFLFSSHTQTSLFRPADGLDKYVFIICQNPVLKVSRCPIEKVLVWKPTLKVTFGRHVSNVGYVIYCARQTIIRSFFFV
jgi:hypothetical protein